METVERNRSPSRRTSRVEQVVGRWLRRSRDSSSRDRMLADGGPSGPASLERRIFPIRVTLQVALDPMLGSYGFSLSPQRPLVVQEVTAGGPADGRLVLGDQVLRINNVAVEDLSSEQVADIIRQSREAVTVTILRHTLGPKSSFITAEKRARLKSNPVKVHFAEEVVVNGHSQGNSLLFLPNVLKVYLENGQTKAFKFEAKTTVKDIVLTLKEKLSIHCIEYFALVLEQQHSIAKLFLLHEDELIEQVVYKRETHDYRCLFRVSFVPRDPLDMLQEDPMAFEYLYLQSVADVLQERFAVEMKCSTALRLAALHIQERLLSIGQTHKVSLKTVIKNWGIENLVSPTLLKNMKGKDLMKALNYHMKKSQTLEPGHKVTSVTEARLNYLMELGQLKSFGGKSFSATMMLQDRDSMVSLLVGAKYGISQVINHKHSIMATLSEFRSISRVELLPESDKVGLVKVYLQEVKPISLMLESQAAKEFCCLVAGYCRLLVDPALTVFLWVHQERGHRVSAEEGYVSRGCSDSEESSELDAIDALGKRHFSRSEAELTPSGVLEEDTQGQRMGRGGGEGRREEEGQWGKDETGKAEEGRAKDHAVEEGLSEVCDSCHSDSHFISSCSSDSMDGLEEDDLITCSASLPANLETYPPYPPSPPAQHDPGGEETASSRIADPMLGFAELSRMAEWLPSPPEASDEEGEGKTPQQECVFNFEEKDTRPYYSICCSVTPNSAPSLSGPQGRCPLEEEVERDMHVNAKLLSVLEPPPSYQDSSSEEEEFFDALDRLSSPEFAVAKVTTVTGQQSRTSSLRDVGFDMAELLEDKEQESVSTFRRKSRKRRSFVASSYTSQVSFPGQDRDSRDEDKFCFDIQNSSLAVSSMSTEEVEPAVLESKSIPASASRGSYGQERESKSKHLSSSIMEMEPDAMEFKSVRELMSAASPIILAVRCRVEPEGRESGRQQGGEGPCAVGPEDTSLSCHEFLAEKAEEASCCQDSSGSSEPVYSIVGDVTEEKIEAILTCEAQVPEMASLGERSQGRPASELSLGQPSVAPETSASPIPTGQKDDKPSVDDIDAVPYPQDCNGSLALALQTGLSYSFESLLGIRAEEAVGSNSIIVRKTGVLPQQPGAFSLQGCTTGLVGRLSTSTLRNKIQRLPWLLSRSHENTSQDAADLARNVGPGLADGDAGLGHADGDADSGHANRDVGSGHADGDVGPEHTNKEAGLGHVDGDTGLGYADGNLDDKTIAAEEEPRFSESASCIRAGLDQQLELGSVSSHRSPVAALCFTEPTVRCGDGLPETVPSDPETAIEQCVVSELPDCTEPWSNVHPCPQGTAALDFSPTFVSVCPSLLEEHQVPETCGCRAIYTNCFDNALDKNRFDEDLTVYEFSCRAQGGEEVPLVNTPPISPVSRSTPPLSSSMELLALSSPLEDILNQLRNRQYQTPAGFLTLQQDLVVLLALLKEAPLGRGPHHQETCMMHFSEDRRLLRAEARKLMSLCQQVIRVGQSPEEVLLALAESFRALVQLASICLWFSSCGCCQRRHTEVLLCLTDVTRTYRDFAQLAEQAGGRKSCHDVVIRLLARQCTVLTASVFYLTQLFRTLSDL